MIPKIRVWHRERKIMGEVGWVRWLSWDKERSPDGEPVMFGVIREGWESVVDNVQAKDVIPMLQAPGKCATGDWYEGDITEYAHGEWPIRRIVELDQQHGWQLRHQSGSTIWPANEAEVQLLCVIGNKWENPELWPEEKEITK